MGLTSRRRRLNRWFKFDGPEQGSGARGAAAVTGVLGGAGRLLCGARSGGGAAGLSALACCFPP